MPRKNQTSNIMEGTNNLLASINTIKPTLLYTDYLKYDTDITY